MLTIIQNTCKSILLYNGKPVLLSRLITQSKLFASIQRSTRFNISKIKYSHDYSLPVLACCGNFRRNSYVTLRKDPSCNNPLNQSFIYLSLCSTRCKWFSTTRNCKSEKEDEKESDNENDSLSDDILDKEYELWSREVLPVAGAHSVLIIQPYIKWGSGKKRNTTVDLQLAEAVALIESLHGWRVNDKMALGLKSFEKKTFFGSGNFDTLRLQIRRDPRITAVFISTKMLRSVQHREIQTQFGVPVFDRYTIVIQLFRQHAVSREAKLQVAMAEIPYMWSRLRGGNEGTDKRTVGQTPYEIRKEVLENRERKLKLAITKLRNHRQLLRVKRNKMEYPIVAVVGYTNAGKTSLIKALTGDENMQPENRLFATLDVSTHMGVLPCRMQVLYIDTIGFISDIPTELLESFVATLEDALFADVIVHVIDASHPDREAQFEIVLKTLQRLQLSTDVMDNIVHVRNKHDLVEGDSESIDDTALPVSALTQFGISDLQKKIEEAVLNQTDRVALAISVPQGGREASWLYKEATVTESEADPRNAQNLLMHVIITKTQLNRFRHYFIKGNN